MSSPNPQAYLYLSALLPHHSGGAAFLLKTVSVKRLGFPPFSCHLLRDLPHAYISTFFSNTQTRIYIFHLKTQNLPRFHSCPTTALTLSPSFNATFLKKFKFLLSHLLPNLLQFGPIPIKPSRGFTGVTKVLGPRSGTCISVFTSCGPL